MSEYPPSARDLLAFYLEAGVDCALSDDAPDRLTENVASSIERPRIERSSSVRAPFLQPSAPILPRGDVAPAPDIAIATARELAPTAATLEDLRALLENFDGCALKATANKVVFADGNPAAKLMLVGEAPGRDEDIEGLPFVGRSGKLLDLMLAAIGLDRTSVYIANIIPWRPPGNRDPSPQETQICLPFIKRQIELVNPDILLCLGKPSSQAVLGVKDGIVKSRGRWLDYDTGTREIKAMATFHPAYLLRQPIHKRLAWQDFLAVKKRLVGH
jgi:DNA polymerase